jgi:hypothetical protein
MAGLYFSVRDTDPMLLKSVTVTGIDTTDPGQAVITGAKVCGAYWAMTPDR